MQGFSKSGSRGLTRLIRICLFSSWSDNAYHLLGNVVYNRNYVLLNYGIVDMADGKIAQLPYLFILNFSTTGVV